MHEHLCNIIKDDFSGKMSQNIWTSSALRWTSDILVNISGTQLNCSATESVQKYFIDSIKHLLPEHGEETRIEVQYCIYPPHSGISLHSDESHNFAATLYLNEYWDINDGGLLIYEDGSKWTAYVPKYNTMAVINDQTRHMVTPVSSNVKYPRYTIQIWGRKKCG